MFVEYLTSNINKSDYIIVIIHGFKLFDKAYECEQAHAILIIDLNNDKNQLNIHKNNHHHLKMGDIFEEHHSMMIKVQQVIGNIEHQIDQQVEDMFNRFNWKEKALQDLRVELGPFLWCQIFKSK